VDPLASSADVATALGVDALTAEQNQRAPGVLAKASNVFRFIAKQDFTPGTSTVRVKVDGGQVRLQQEPVTAVASVVDDHGNAVDYTRAGQLLTLTHACGSRRPRPLGSHEFVTVTYSHGGDVPDDVRQCIAEIAAKVLSIDKRARAGIASGTRTAGHFTEVNNYAAWAIGGATTLAPDDEKLALSFRYPGRHVYVAGR
jgi:hypothetical protein